MKFFHCYFPLLLSDLSSLRVWPGKRSLHLSFRGGLYSPGEQTAVWVLHRLHFGWTKGVYRQMQKSMEMTWTSTLFISSRSTHSKSNIEISRYQRLIEKKKRNRGKLHYPPLAFDKIFETSHFFSSRNQKLLKIKAYFCCGLVINWPEYDRMKTNGEWSFCENNLVSSPGQSLITCENFICHRCTRTNQEWD